MKKYFRIVIIVAVPVMLLGMLYMSRRSSGVVEVNSGFRVVMGTFSRVVVIARSQRAAQRCIEAAFDVQNRIEALMSDFRADSELSKVNRLAAQGPVPVSEMTFEVLQQSVHFSTLSEGAFDVTVGPLVDLWRKAGKMDVPPTDEALAEARRKVGSDKLILDEKNRTVRFAVAGMRVDLGGIGKGYAVDKAVEAMRKCGARGGLVDLGGNIRCFGRPPQDQERWRIGLQDPNVAPDEFGGTKPLLILALANESVATSGDYRRFVKVQGQKQSHIIDTATGQGANKLVSDTIIASDATTADALSTAVNVLGLEKGLALVERVSGAEAILIPAGKEAQLIFSRGARAYLVPSSEAARPDEK
ncbi:MAG: FAD:protein FMN transferase [Planctomycetes bacterium]|nr:FAD:protein FMN transferase [Planctomycetota bacterium]